ncbi:MAG TPA: DUF2127 domain-containing protein [Gemmatimonadaceae bacterium]|nr:DUF2127 domain-containing protein [Gemmatimonadaceae bacterium]
MTTRRSLTPRAWHRLFRLGMIAKAVDGVVQSAAGLALLLLSPRAINAIVLFFVRGELREDPRDLLANLLLHAGAGVVRIQLFAGLLLVAHGLLKLVLVASVERNQRWAYPTAIVVFGGFVVYQAYQIAVRPSAFLWVVTIVDVVVIALIAHEYTTLAPLAPGARRGHRW